MKKSIMLSVLFLAFMAGAKSQDKSTGYSSDDVYSGSSDHKKTTPKTVTPNADLTGSKPVMMKDTAVITKPSAASTPDYSNNSYGLRAKKFKDANAGTTYSSDDTTATSGGSAPAANIYVGSGWGSPFWGPSLSFGMGFGFGDFGYEYGYPYYGYWPYCWDYPFCSYSPYYYGFWNYPYFGGYWHHHGLWDWNNGNFRNYYYGQRKGTPVPLGIRTTPSTNVRAGQLKSSKTVNPAYVNRVGGAGRAISNIPPDKQRYNYVRVQTPQNTRVARTNPNGVKAQSNSNYVQRQQQPAPRYIRPGIQQQGARTTAQTYSSPAYRQPKSSQEYINPRPQGQNSTRPAVNNSAGARRYSTPSYNGGNRIYSNPSGGSRMYSSPSRSYSSPGSSRSMGSGYSGGSHSSGGGGGSHSSSGGGRSGGGGRR
jgi:hypothetical protein